MYKLKIKMQTPFQKSNNFHPKSILRTIEGPNPLEIYESLMKIEY